MAINQVISSIKVDSATDDNKVPTYDAATDTFTMETPSAGGGSMTLLHAGTGSVVDTSTSTVDSIAISGLTALDTIVIYSTLYANSGNDGGSWLVYSVTDTVTLIRVDGASGIFGAQPNIASTVTMRQTPNNSTSISSSNAVGSDLSATGAVSFARVGGVTAWTSSFTIGLRHTADPFGAGLNTDWTWAVYKLAGQ